MFTIAPWLRPYWAEKLLDDDLVFLYLIFEVNEERWAGHAQVVIVRTVDLKVIRTSAVAVDGQTSSVRIRARAALIDNAWRQQRQRVKTTSSAVRRQIFHLTGIDRRRNLRLIALHNFFGAGRDRYRL